jgi:hypothetical protein
LERKTVNVIVHVIIVIVNVINLYYNIIWLRLPFGCPFLGLPQVRQVGAFLVLLDCPAAASALSFIKDS